MKIRSILASILSLATCLAAATAYLAPDPSATVTPDFKTEKSQKRASINYHSDLISISGTIDSEIGKNTIRFQGTYQSQQNLEPGLKLAFQIYSPSGELLLLDGGRTDFLEEANGKTARFNYAYQLNELNIPESLSEFLIKFNYVQEGQYWMDVRYPDTELPAIRIQELDRGESFKIRLSYVPSFTPKGSQSYTLQWYETTRAIDSPFNHVASIEAFDPTFETRFENKRFPIPSAKGKTNRLGLFPYQFEQSGEYMLRLGFVWDGVQWYPGSSNAYRQTHVLEIWTYCLIAAIASLAIAGCVKLAKKQSNRYLKIAADTATVGLIFVFCLEFLSPFLPLFVICLSGILLSRFRIAATYHSYWTLLLYFFANELILSYILKIGPHTWQALLFSFSVTALALAPIVLVRPTWLRICLANTLFVLGASYHLTMAFYFQFFQDFPNFNLLTYASQGTKLTDSIISLADPRFSAFAYTSLLFLLTLNFAKPQPPQTNADS